MTSQIIPTNPTAGSASTSSVRENFRIADEEITKLQRTNIDAQELTGGPISYSVTYPLAESVFEYVDGMRIAARVNQTNSASSVLSLSVNSSTSILLKSLDGSALAAGDLAADQYYEFILNSPGGGATPYFACVNINKNFKEVSVEGITVTSPALGNTAGDESIQATFSTANANASYLKVQDERWENGTDWFSASKFLQFGIDASDHAYIASSTEASGHSGIEIGTHDGAGNREKFFVGDADGGAYLFYDNVKKLQTVSDGIDVTGGIAADYINLNGNNSSDVETPITGDVLCKRLRLDDPTTGLNDNFTIFTENNTSGSGGDAGSMVLSAQDNTDDKIILRMGNQTAGVHDTVDILTATATAIRIPATKRLQFGTESSGYLEIFEGNDGKGHIKQVGTGDLVISATDGYLNGDSNNLAYWSDNQIKLKYQSSDRFATESFGTTTTGISKAANFQCDVDQIVDDTTWSVFSRNGGSNALYVQQGGSASAIASFRKGSLNAGAGTEVLGVRSGGIVVGGTIQGQHIANDGTVGFTGTASNPTSFTIKNGLITAIS